MPKKSARKKGATDTPSNLLTPIYLPVAKSKDNPSPSTQPKPKRIIKKPTSFLDLPPEIRNQIYGYHFQQDFRCEFAGKDARLGYKYTDENGAEKLTQRMEFQPKGIKQAPLTAVRFSGKLGSSPLPPLSTNWSQSLTPLPLTSLTLSLETTPLLYHTTTFTFDAPSRIHSFLSLPASLLVHVSKIHLHYSPYGDPQSLAHEIYARKHVDSWDKACAALATRLVNLRELDVWINVTESRVYFSMGAVWLRPLARFRRMQGTKGEEKGGVKVNVRVDSRWTRRGAFAVEELGVHAGELHRLFGEGIARGVMGGREEECMRGFREYWGGPCWGWQEHLRFGNVG